MQLIFLINSFGNPSSEAVKHKVETHSLVARQPLPVNSIDVVSIAVLLMLVFVQGAFF